MNNKKILIVEDDENIRELLRLYLEREGYEISEAENGAVGLSKWKAENPDMMLLDVMMPVMDGWQVIREVRESGSSIPVIMITADTSADSMSHAYELGVADYIERPFDVQVVRRRVMNTVKLYARQRRLRGFSG